MSKILIIEDDVILTELLRKTLESDHFRVVTAGDGLQGTTLAHNEKPDLILLDLIMPLGGGVVALRNLKISTHTKAIPVVIISGTEDAHLIDQVKSMGIAAFVAKPFTATDLAAKVKAILSK
jgi:DNA-binding response OmpR family regulator